MKSELTFNININIPDETAEDLIDLLKDYRSERDKAFINFVTTDDMDMVREHCKKYGVPIPESPKVFTVGIYRAVQYCTNIPKDIKELAAQKCSAIGFEPTIYFGDIGGNEE